VCVGQILGCTPLVSHHLTTRQRKRERVRETDQSEESVRIHWREGKRDRRRKKEGENI